jgi:5-methylcytosine-specific restriction enzyme A
MPTKKGLAKLYDTAAWQRRRELQLKQFPLCAVCFRAGAVTPATCVDHVER